MTPLVSVLVPIYGVAQFIERCAESLMRQTLADIEYIFVDDCSPDDSVEILRLVVDRFPERKENVQILHHPKNLGLECARQTALARARGQYLIFVDSDDYVDTRLVESMYSRAILTDADIVVADFYSDYGHNKIVRNNDYVSTDVDKWFYDMLANDHVYGCLWNKIYRRSLFDTHQYPIPHIACCEDWSANIQLFHRARRIVKITDAFYYYVCYNAQSITKSNIARKVDDYLEFWHRVDTFLDQWGETDKYHGTVQWLKLRQKANIMLNTADVNIRRQYNYLYNDIPRLYSHFLKKGHRMALWLADHRMFHTIGLLRWLLLVKQKF